MTNPLQFAKNQDRTYFNVHTPVRLSYDDVYPSFNRRGPLEPQSEVDRQTGSGLRIMRPSIPPPFYTMPVSLQGMGAMQNNFDPSVKAPIDKVYEYTPKFQTHSPIMNKIHAPLMHGSGSFAPLRHHNQPNPAINNWKPGTRIPEPTKIYELSSSLQIHSQPTDPIREPPRRGPSISGHMSYDDYKPFDTTKQYMNTGQFRHISHNPLIIRG
jgi:hypothetical protein